MCSTKRQNTCQHQNVAKYLTKSHKFGIELPNTVQEAYALNAKNGKTLWADAIPKEMENVRVAFEVLPDGKSVPIGH